MPCVLIDILNLGDSLRRIDWRRSKESEPPLVLDSTTGGNEEPHSGVTAKGNTLPASRGWDGEILTPVQPANRAG